MRDEICYGCMTKKKDSGQYCRNCGFNLDQYLDNQNPDYIKPGVVLNDRYLIGKVIATDDISIVYIAYDRRLDQKISLQEFFPKEVVRRDQDGLAVLTDDQDRLSNMQSTYMDRMRQIARYHDLPGIVSIDKILEENNTCYFVIDQIPSGTLEDKTSFENEPPSQDMVLKWFTPMTEALSKLHGDGLSHGMIRPSCIYYDAESDSMFLSGFDRSKDGMGASGASADVTALCSCIYYAMTGFFPEPGLGGYPAEVPLSIYDSGLPATKEFSDLIQSGFVKGIYHDMGDFTHSMERAGFIEKKNVSVRPVSLYSEPEPSRRSYEHSATSKDVSRNNGYTVHQSMPNYYMEDEYTERPSSGRGLKIAVAAVAAIAVVVIAAFFVLKPFGNKEGIKKAAVQSQKTEQNTEAAKSYEKEVDGWTTSDAGSYATVKKLSIKYVTAHAHPGDGQVQYKFPEGKIARVYGSGFKNGAKWCYAEYFGQKGWVAASDLRFVTKEDLYYHITHNPEKDTIFVNALNGCHLHTGPSKQDPIVDKVPYGREFVGYEIKDGYIRVKYNGIDCWLNMRYGNYYSGQYWQVEIANGKNSSHEIKLRMKPDKGADIIGKYPSGVPGRISEYQNGWGYINAVLKDKHTGQIKNTYEGWVQLHYLTPCNRDGLKYSEDYPDKTKTNLTNGENK